MEVNILGQSPCSLLHPFIHYSYNIPICTIEAVRLEHDVMTVLSESAVLQQGGTCALTPKTPRRLDLTKGICYCLEIICYLCELSFYKNPLQAFLGIFVR